MLKKAIGAVIGSKVAKRLPAVGGKTGAVAGAAVPMVLGRLGLPGLVLVAAGGYAAKRVMDRRAAAKAPAAPAPTNPIPVAWSGDH